MVAVCVSDIGIQRCGPTYQSCFRSASTQTQAGGQSSCSVIISSLCETRRRRCGHNNDPVFIRFYFALRILVTVGRFDLVVKGLSHVPRFEQRAHNSWSSCVIAGIGCKYYCRIRGRAKSLECSVHTYFVGVVIMYYQRSAQTVRWKVMRITKLNV